MKFKNKKTGCIETVTNKMVIEQYEKRPEVYVKMTEGGKPAKKTTKKSK